MFKWLIGGSDNSLDQVEKDHKKMSINDVEDQKSLDKYISELVVTENTRENN